MIDHSITTSALSTFYTAFISIYATVAIYSLCIGSFLNVCIYRIPRQLSLSTPARSFCPLCGQQLHWYNNIPLISWIFLGGKCGFCKETISYRYPVVELLSAMAAIFSLKVFGVTGNALMVYALLCVLIVITYIDLDFQIIPDSINFSGMIIGLGMGLYSSFVEPLSFPFVACAFDSLAGLLMGGGSLLAIIYLFYWCTGKIGMGGGDVKLMAMFGALMGYQCLFTILMIGSLMGSVFGLTLIAFGKKDRFSEIPFGPWLALGCIIYILTSFPLYQTLEQFGPHTFVL